MDKGKKSAEKDSTERASAPSSVSPISMGGGGEQYDVYLSFKGSDTRKTFTDHLYRGLLKAGTKTIFVFMDYKSIPIGEEFGSRLLSTIKRSKISIPIISENYASSKWCLRELIQIMDCKKSTSHLVLPIFYKVAPSDVRYLKGSFGEAFHSHKNRFDEKDIQEGKRALKEVSELHGWESENFANGHEGELVEKVIKIVLSKLRHDFQLDVTEHLVGIGNHLNEIRNWVDNPANAARMIGIYGMGGIGKTTLARVIYNELSNNFEHHSFFPDIRETAHRNGIPYLQNQLLKDILRIKDQIMKVDDGISLIKSRFKGKKVLILLDDIDHMDHLNALAREPDWFTWGSIIIVTTRNKSILDQSRFKVDYKYELNDLDEKHSLLLFNKHAFRMNNSSKGFEDISRDIISTMGGLPLALEVIGSYLYGKTNRKVWQDMLEKLRNEPNRDVQNILKLSFDALERGHQEIFLDIACFFIGKESKFAMYMWEDCGFYANQGIEELKLRCLIKIENDGKLRMHDQLRDLGRNIVCQEGPPERRSRLWNNKEASGVLMGGKGTEKIQAICLHKDIGYFRRYRKRQFKKLQSLRFLHMKCVALSGNFDILFSELRWLRWHGTKKKRLTIFNKRSFSATSLRLPKLVVLELSEPWITEQWRGWSSIMVAKRLKVLNLADCANIRCTPDLSTFTELEILILRSCYRLKQVHPSIGKVKSLVSLDLSHCWHLKKIPEEVGELEELKELEVVCTRITKIPSSIGSLRKLEKLSAWGCKSLREIPSSIGNLSSLQHLNLGHCQALRKIPSSIGDLQNLQHLDMSYCAIEKLPGTIGRLQKLQSLILTKCSSLKGVPSEIGELSYLQKLSIWGCFKLRSLPKLPSSLTNLSISCQSRRLPQVSCLIHLEVLDLFNCNILEYIPELSQLDHLKEFTIGKCGSIDRLDLSQLNCVKRLYVKYCDNLVEIQRLDNLEFLEEIHISHCKSIERLILVEVRCLKKFTASHCDNLVEIRGLDRMEFLETLDIRCCGSIKRLPDLSCFATLKELNINGCRNLRSVESLERFLFCRSIYIEECKSLEKLPNLSKFKNLETFTLKCSLHVTEIPGVEKSRSLRHMDITGCKSMQTLPDLSGCKKLGSLVARDCKKLTQLRGLEKLNIIYLDISGCDSLETIPKLATTRVMREYGSQLYVEGNRNIILQ
ncbi:disease resistance protein RUN1-like isoform X2 [Syzygium oleosum]|uniref:disease resistance protein RUN1-like isoform X2 n=1 Tax=Syzygium oleosum TaxID=219896 RepID=UPI0024BB10CF|nr:disease resistance protein RUN1-like isoform X2 [Syzygium oleosum]XP_056165113.1 disease resistance protein RUN1-like isoform X2 [Syzygium oleosum]